MRRGGGPAPNELQARAGRAVGTKLAPVIAEFVVKDLAGMIDKISAAVKAFETMKETFDRIIGAMRTIGTNFVNFFTQDVVEPIMRAIEKVTDAYDSLPAWARGDKINFNAPEIPVVGNPTPNKTGAIAGELVTAGVAQSINVQVNTTGVVGLTPQDLSYRATSRPG